MSRTSAAFRKAFGTSIGKYALSVKMREAKRLAAYRAFYGRTPSSDRRP